MAEAKVVASAPPCNEIGLIAGIGVWGGRRHRYEKSQHTQRRRAGSRTACAAQGRVEPRAEDGFPRLRLPRLHPPVTARPAALLSRFQPPSVIIGLAPMIHKGMPRPRSVLAGLAISLKRTHAPWFARSRRAMTDGQGGHRT